MNSIALCDIGRQREINQDCVFKSDDAIGFFPNLYIVADGMGGHKAGDYASQFCVSELRELIKVNSSKTLLGGLESAITVMNERLYAKSVSEPELNGMGTTLVATVVTENTALVANVGDSRMYLYSKEEGLKQITIDHSLVEILVRNGELDKRDAVRHPKKNIITRAVGVEPIVEIDFFEVDISKGDIILLCSDGLTNMVDDDRICGCLQSDIKSLSSKAQELIKIANERGGKDNISVVLIEI